MISDEALKNLPSDPELAFVEFERIIRNSITDKNGEIEYGKARQYVNLLYAFIDEHKIDVGIDSTRAISDNTGFYNHILELAERFATRVRIRKHRDVSPNFTSVVRFNSDYREQVHEKISLIRKILLAADIREARREELFRKLNALASEVDKEHTTSEALTSIWLEATQAIGEGAENLEPVLKLLERIAKIFGKARSEEDVKELPAGQVQRLLEGPTEEHTE